MTDQPPMTPERLNELLDTDPLALRNAAVELLQRVQHYENALTWHTNCLNCSRLLDASYTETRRAERAEAERDSALQQRDQSDAEAHRARAIARFIDRELAAGNKIAAVHSDGLVVEIKIAEGETR
jgi:hypothetical protein